MIRKDEARLEEVLMKWDASYVHRFLVLDLDDIAYQNTSSLSFFLSLFAHKYVGQKHGALV